MALVMALTAVKHACVCVSVLCAYVFVCKCGHYVCACVLYVFVCVCTVGVRSQESRSWRKISLPSNLHALIDFTPPLCLAPGGFDKTSTHFKHPDEKKQQHQWAPNVKLKGPGNQVHPPDQL